MRRLITLKIKLSISSDGKARSSISAENAGEIIMSDFPNGIRDDFIDTNKVLRIYSSKHADEKISKAGRRRDSFKRN